MRPSTETRAFRSEGQGTLPALRAAPALATQYEPLLTNREYDPDLRAPLEARGAERGGRCRSLPPCLSWTTYAFLHLFASYDNSELKLPICGEIRITPHAIVGGDSNVCSAVSYFSTRVG